MGALTRKRIQLPGVQVCKPQRAASETQAPSVTATQREHPVHNLHNLAGDIAPVPDVSMLLQQQQHRTSQTWR